MTLTSPAGERYRVEERIGRGGMATVYRARDRELDRTVAIKVLADEFAGDRGVRARFLREGRLAARLTHPNVVAVFDAGERDGRPFIVMEHVDGETVADLLRRRGRLEPEEAVRLVLQACDGLEGAHAEGLVHRDVKPQNLLLRHDGTVKLADFGIARAADATQLTQAGTILGTAAYLAPEQAAGHEVETAADVYSLGAVLYELLAGRPPFQDASLEELVLRHTGEEAKSAPPLPASVPPELEEVVMRALARLPEHRPQSAGALATALRAAVGPEPVTEELAPASGPLPEAATEVVRPRAAAPSRAGAAPPPRRAAAVAGVALASIALVVLALALLPGRLGDGGGDAPSPASVEPVPRVDSPEEQARALAGWIRRHSG